MMASGTNTGSVMMWDIELRELMWEHSHHAGRVESLAFNSLSELSSAVRFGVNLSHICISL